VTDKVQIEVIEPIDKLKMFPEQYIITSNPFIMYIIGDLEIGIVGDTDIIIDGVQYGNTSVLPADYNPDDDHYISSHHIDYISLPSFYYRHNTVVNMFANLEVFISGIRAKCKELGLPIPGFAV